MENAARALEIAAGVLIAIMILSLLAYFFASLSTMPKQENESMTTQQLHAFNTEYEAYRKSTMYGVDVISCLNKAENNNKKYNEGEGFLSGLVYSKNEGGKNDPYYVDVFVRVNSCLEESLELWYIHDNQEDQYFGNTDDDSRYGEYTMSKVGFSFPSDYRRFQPNTRIGTKSEVLEGDGFLNPGGGEDISSRAKFELYPLNGNSNNYYSLRDSEELHELLKNSGNNMVQTVTNNTKRDYDIYTKVIWKTALYDMKTRKFKCDYVEYSADTGRVIALYFSEIPKRERPEAVIVPR